MRRKTSLEKGRMASLAQDQTHFSNFRAVRYSMAVVAGILPNRQIRFDAGIKQGRQRLYTGKDQKLILHLRQQLKILFERGARRHHQHVCAVKVCFERHHCRQLGKRRGRFQPLFCGRLREPLGRRACNNCRANRTRNGVKVLLVSRTGICGDQRCARH